MIREGTVERRDSKVKRLKLSTMNHRRLNAIACSMATVILMTISGIAFASSCGESGPLSEFVANHYPEDLVFDVYRNDKLVGQHISTFKRSENGTAVESEMTLNVKILFVTVYTFRYTSSAKWCGERLIELTAKTDRNGDISNVEVKRLPEGLRIMANGESVTAAGDAIPTNHWNPAVLNRQEVINTISGQLNKVSIEQCKYGNALIEKSANDAQCHEYSGDLTTRVWYDSVGRWRGLEFKADDGSTITYRCRRCV